MVHQVSTDLKKWGPVVDDVYVVLQFSTPGSLIVILTIFQRLSHIHRPTGNAHRHQGERMISTQYLPMRS